MNAIMPRPREMPARVTGQDRSTIAAHALEVARGQETINDG
jgi:hypothetical protein